MTAISLNAPKLFDLSGNVAFVTGAGSGIGQRIAMGLAQCGADIALLDRRQDDGLAVTAEFVRKAGRKAIEIAADVTNKASLADAVARTEPSSACSRWPSTPPALRMPIRPKRWKKTSTRR